MLVFASILEIKFIVVLSRSRFYRNVSFGERNILACEAPILADIFFGFLRDCTVEQEVDFQPLLKQFAHVFSLLREKNTIFFIRKV